MPESLGVCSTVLRALYVLRVRVPAGAQFQHAKQRLASSGQTSPVLLLALGTGILLQPPISSLTAFCLPPIDLCDTNPAPTSPSISCLHVEPPDDIITTIASLRDHVRRPGTVLPRLVALQLAVE